MGCDIHFYVEVKKDDKWVSADEWNKKTYHYPTGNQDWWRVPEPFYGDRNYRLFSVLAGVRNWWDTPQEILPLADAKGLPPDISVELKERVEWGELHHKSWFTLKELESYPWDLTLPFDVWVLKEYAEKYKKCKVLPQDWISESYMNNKDRSLYEYMNLEIPISFLCQEFINVTIPELKSLGNSEEVRVVFGFDN